MKILLDAATIDRQFASRRTRTSNQISCCRYALASASSSILVWTSGAHPGS
jgi:hypothetical protein